MMVTSRTTSCIVVSQRRNSDVIFILAEGIEILKAHLNGGLLHTNLEESPPEPQVRNIPITTDP